MKQTFEEDIFYDNRIHEVTCRHTAEGYQVQLDLTGRKAVADREQRERELPEDEWVEVGLLNGDGDILTAPKVRFTSGPFQVTLASASEPRAVRIDPYAYSITRHPSEAKASFRCH